MHATWQFRSLPGLKNLKDTELHKLFKFPKYRFILPDKPLYHELNIEKYSDVEYGKEKAMHCIFHYNLKERPAIDLDWNWYMSVNGGSAVNFGSSFTFSPSVAAQQTAFWLPLEMWCYFPEKYPAYKKGVTLSIRIEADNVPMKIKRIWFKKYLLELSKCRNGVSV